MTQKKYKKGMEAYTQALSLDPTIFEDNGSPRVSNPSSVQDRGALSYYTALGCVRAAQTDCTIKALRAALNQGYITAKKLAADPAFQSLRDNPEFQQLLVSQQEPPKQ